MIAYSIRHHWLAVLALLTSLLAPELAAQLPKQPDSEERRQTQLPDSQGDQSQSRLRSQRRTFARPLKVGQLAPTFQLASPDGKDTFDLREFRGKRPVVLIFGSYT
jgi:hypothetical protein